ncbi:hypothetical protein GCM10020331_046420 [Ectobacillus funiculus]
MPIYELSSITLIKGGDYKMSDLYSRLSKKNDAAVLLVDHQNGLISGLVRDYGVDEFKNNVFGPC